MGDTRQASKKEWGEASIAALREEFDRHLAAAGLSGADAARSIGLSRAAISGWRTGKYNGDMSGMSERIRRYLDEYEDQFKNVKVAPAATTPTAEVFVETQAARQVLMTLKYARKMSDLAVVYGDPGTGKTYSLRHYQRQHPDEVVLVTAAPHHHRPAAIMSDLAEAAGLPPVRRNRNLRGVFSDLVKAVQGRDILLIVDEAQHLSLEALEELRSVHDAAGVSLVLAGNEDVYDQLHGRGRAGFAQLWSRVSLVARIRNSLSAGDVRSIASEHLGDALDDESLSYLLSLGRKAGALRAVSKCCRLAAVLLRDDKSLPTLAALQGASTMMMPAA